MMINLELSRADVMRLLAGVRERKRRAEHGLKKFADNFDPEKGKNLLESFEDYERLEKYLDEAANPRGAGRHS